MIRLDTIPSNRKTGAPYRSARTIAMPAELVHEHRRDLVMTVSAYLDRNRNPHREIAEAQIHFRCDPRAVASHRSPLDFAESVEGRADPERAGYVERAFEVYVGQVQPSAAEIVAQITRATAFLLL
jgi:hypothetical protein